ncbi:hypothetical protein OCEANICA350_11404 [Oceanicaulis sp. 350]|nr:hypothetical protein OCEANICA350_11404 [Oceanicaulis sp. 350]
MSVVSFMSQYPGVQEKSLASSLTATPRSANVLLTPERMCAIHKRMTPSDAQSAQPEGAVARGKRR